MLAINQASVTDRSSTATIIQTHGTHSDGTYTVFTLHQTAKPLQSISDRNQGHGGRLKFKGAPVVSTNTADLYYNLNS